MRLMFLLILFYGSADCQSQNKKLPFFPPTNASIVVGENILIPGLTPGLAIVEPHLSIHPTNPNHMLVAAMLITQKDNPYESAQLISFLSEDRGKSWHQTNHDYFGYDPWTAILSNGNTVMSWLGQPHSFTGEMPIRLFFSENGGKHWKQEVQHIAGEYDGTKMAIDHLQNKIIFAAASFGENMDVDIYMDQSSGGQRFDQPTRIKIDGDRLRFAEPAVLGNGIIALPVQEERNAVYCRISADGAKSFNERYLITRKLGVGKGYFSFASDPINNRLYFVRAVGKDNKYDGIWINFSSDLGKSWSRDIRVDWFDQALPSKAMVPNVAVNKDGIVGISWIDEQTKSGQKDMYFAVSSDKGVSFGRAVRVTSQSSNPATPLNADVANKFPGGGHYNTMACASDGNFQLVWADSRTGVFRLQTCQIKIK
jgi:hypothetical protein